MLENIDKRKLLIGALIALIAIIIALILWWLFGPKASTPPAVVPPTQPETAVTVPGEPSAIPLASPERIQDDKSYPLGLKQLAMAFAERFGSYSTDEPVKNMADLEPFMTDKMKNTSSLIDPIDNGGIFNGYSTKSLSSTLISINAASAVIVVKTQRTQTLGTEAITKTFYADLELKAVKSGNEWKIDEAKWQ